MKLERSGELDHLKVHLEHVSDAIKFIEKNKKKEKGRNERNKNIKLKGFFVYKLSFPPPLRQSICIILNLVVRVHFTYI